MRKIAWQTQSSSSEILAGGQVCQSSSGFLLSQTFAGSHVTETEQHLVGKTGMPTYLLPQSLPQALKSLCLAVQWHPPPGDRSCLPHGSTPLSPKFLPKNLINFLKLTQVSFLRFLRRKEAYSHWSECLPGRRVFQKQPYLLPLNSAILGNASTNHGEKEGTF